MSGETKHERHWTSWKNPLWWIFCMPGALFMWIQYWFPSKGRILISGRQYGNKFVQFVFTIIFYGFVVFVYFHLRKDMQNPAI